MYVVPRQLVNLDLFSAQQNIDSKTGKCYRDGWPGLHTALVGGHSIALKMVCVLLVFRQTWGQFRPLPRIDTHLYSPPQNKAILDVSVLFPWLSSS